MIEGARYRPTTDDLIAVLAGLGAVAGSYAATGFTPRFVASPVEAALSRHMPAAVVTFAIQQLGSLGQQLNLLTATVLTVLAFGALVRLAIHSGNRLGNRAVPVVFGGALGWILAVVLTRDFASAAGAALGVAAVLVLSTIASARRANTDDAPATDRRRVLGAIASTVGISAIAIGRTASDAGPDGPTIPEDASPAVRENLEAAAERSLDVDGIEPLVSRDFYQVDISATDPTVSVDEWSLSVTGEVESERTYSYEEIRSMPARTEFQTIRCVGEGLNGHKMDNALWTGVPAMDLIESAGPAGECNCVKLHAADGYFQVFPLDALRGGLFAYRMNGRDLPRGHGYPLRALVPGHWGEVQVKWLEAIELLDREEDGYWERRGWHGTGPVNTVAKLHAVNDLAGGRKQVAGHAYAGTRGVSAVEVSIDGGDTWEEARLSEPLPDHSVAPDGPSGQSPYGPDVWRQWAYEFRPPDHGYEVVVRAIEDDGTVQPREESQAFPSGATGWVSREF